MGDTEHEQEFKFKTAQNSKNLRLNGYTSFDWNSKLVWPLSCSHTQRNQWKHCNSQKNVLVSLN